MAVSARTNKRGAVSGGPSASGLAEAGVRAADIDISLLEVSLRMSFWERMLANDDALNFGELLHAAMERRNAES